MDENNYVTIKEFIQKVWEVEHVKININADPNFLINQYIEDPLPGDATVNDLNTRLMKYTKTIKNPIFCTIVY